ncbi:hypothetical protein AAGY34_13585, partial [Staphylococcus aureus]
APTQRISKRNSTGNASWGVGPNKEADEKSAYNNVQVGLIQTYQQIKRKKYQVNQESRIQTLEK